MPLVAPPAPPAPAAPAGMVAVVAGTAVSSAGAVAVPSAVWEVTSANSRLALGT